MKKLILSLCLALVLANLPGTLSAGQISTTKPVRIVTNSVLWVTIGTLVGVAVAGFTASSSGSPVAIGACVGLVLGVGLAVITPTWEVEEQSRPQDFAAGPGPGSDQTPRPFSRVMVLVRAFCSSWRLSASSMRVVMSLP